MTQDEITSEILNSIKYESDLHIGNRYNRNSKNSKMNRYTDSENNAENSVKSLNIRAIPLTDLGPVSTDRTNNTSNNNNDNGSQINNEQRALLDVDRWESMESRKSGKKYWRDTITGATAWRLPKGARIITHTGTPHMRTPHTGRHTTTPHTIALYLF